MRMTRSPHATSGPGMPGLRQMQWLVANRFGPVVESPFGAKSDGRRMCERHCAGIFRGNYYVGGEFNHLRARACALDS